MAVSTERVLFGSLTALTLMSTVSAKTGACLYEYRLIELVKLGGPSSADERLWRLSLGRGKPPAGRCWAAWNAFSVISELHL